VPPPTNNRRHGNTTAAAVASSTGGGPLTAARRFPAAPFFAPYPAPDAANTSHSHSLLANRRDGSAANAVAMFFCPSISRNDGRSTARQYTTVRCASACPRYLRIMTKINEGRVK